MSDITDETYDPDEQQRTWEIMLELAERDQHRQLRAEKLRESGPHRGRYARTR